MPRRKTLPCVTRLERGSEEQACAGLIGSHAATQLLHRSIHRCRQQNARKKRNEHSPAVSIELPNEYAGKYHANRLAILRNEPGLALEISRPLRPAHGEPPGALNEYPQTRDPDESDEDR